MNTTRYLSISTFLLTLLTLCVPATVNCAETLTKRVDKALQILQRAEQKYSPPRETWFSETQDSLRAEVRRVSSALEDAGPEYAVQWKTHLKWDLLERNLNTRHVDLAELELVRRWMYSNREGLEKPLFQELRFRMDEFLDAAFTFSHAKLHQAFVEQIQLARVQCGALEQDPSDPNAANLGRTLGWLDRTGLLPAEVRQIRTLLSGPNVQVVVASSLAPRILSLFDTHISHSIRIRDSEESPPGGLLRQTRTLQIRGSAKTSGETSLHFVPNGQEAQINVSFKGNVHARTAADAGPAVIHVVTTGPVQATTPIFIGRGGLRMGTTSVESRVNTNVNGITARRNFVRRIASRRAAQPNAKSSMRTSGQHRTRNLLKENMDERVNETLEEIKRETATMRESYDRFGDVLAPVAREGAQPYLHGLRSSLRNIEVNIMAARRHQLGAVEPFNDETLGGDVQARVHISTANNMLETILGGKRLSDEFLMRYAKILQAELPLDMMVHSRAKRWALTTSKHRPLELAITGRDRFRFTMRITKLEVDTQHITVPATATMDYELVKDDFDDYALVRDGDVELDTDLPPEHREFLRRKMNAFFAPVLNGGGVIVPDGDVFGPLNGLQLVALKVERDWIAVAIDIPTKVFEEVMRLREEKMETDDTLHNDAGYAESNTDADSPA